MGHRRDIGGDRGQRRGLALAPTGEAAGRDPDKERILASKKGNAKPEITRFKGLGEMPAKTLWETTLNPAVRRLLKVGIQDGLETDRVISELMGKDPAPRFEFIQGRASAVEDDAIDA